MNPFDKLGMEFADILGPWIAILVSIAVAFWFKDFVTNLMQGLKFKMNPAFNEGDAVILDDQDAIIVKIGLRESVFGIYSLRGYTWRYISNDRLHMIKLEKIVNKSLHLDTDSEKGRKIQELIDMHQNNQISTNAAEISSNKEEIEKLKNGK
tara:strand:+ start:119 stop:574 length:456 start_codon:yes stop_codon:yes gene_type:complete